MYCVYIFLFTTQISAVCVLVQNRHIEVTGYLGGSVVLPCSCTDSQDEPEHKTWKYYTGNSYEEIYPSENIERYKNRVQLLKQSMPRNVSLLLSSLTREDKGDYICLVSPDKYIHIKLHVKDCDVVGNKNEIEVTGYLGDSVLLPCFCTELRAKPKQLQWKYFTTEGPLEMYPSDPTEIYKKRIKLSDPNTPGNLSVLLSSITKEDAKDYQCSVSPDEYIYIRLHVHERTTHVHTFSSTSQPLQQTHEYKSNEQPKYNLTQKRIDPYVILILVFASVLLLALLAALIFWRFKGGRNVKVTPDDQEQVRENEDEVTYTAVVHAKHSSTLASTRYKLEDTEYSSVNVKQP